MQGQLLITRPPARSPLSPVNQSMLLSQELFMVFQVQPPLDSIYFFQHINWIICIGHKMKEFVIVYAHLEEYPYQWKFQVYCRIVAPYNALIIHFTRVINLFKYVELVNSFCHWVHMYGSFIWNMRRWTKHEQHRFCSIVVYIINNNTTDPLTAVPNGIFDSSS